MAETVADLKETPLAALHRELGARMVPFAGYAMPVQYPTGIIVEHKHVRSAAGLFDVSHMGQAFVRGPDHATAAAALEALTPGDLTGLAPGRIRYTLLLSGDGGIIDDLMVNRSSTAENDGTLMLVVNAARKDYDFSHLQRHLTAPVVLHFGEERALLALQGPAAAAVLARHVPAAANLGFMTARGGLSFDGIDCHVSRSGYTGEDGFEISMPADRAEAIARALLAEPEVLPIGLGARDSLRLEAGLCLYGHDIDMETSPVEADLGFAIARRRREEGGFPGAARILDELIDGPPRKRVGLLPEGKSPVREGAAIFDEAGSEVGKVTSGGFGATIGRPIAMGYVAAPFAGTGTRVGIELRGSRVPAEVAALPFVPHRYFRKSG